MVKDGKAEKRRVSVGGNSYEYVEIIEGLSEGEKVITSDMEDYIRKQSLKIK